MARNGRALKKLMLVYKNTTLDEFINYLKPKLQHFAKHNFVAQWEDKHFKNCINYFPANTIIFVVDFAENYNVEVQNEMQSG